MFSQLDEFSEEEEDGNDDDEEEESDDNDTRLKSRKATFRNGKNTLQQGSKDRVIHTYSKSRETVGSLGFNGQRKVYFVLLSAFYVY